jgi:hypothetical protein
LRTSLDRMIEKKSDQGPNLVKVITFTIYVLSASIFPWLILGTYGDLFAGPLRRIFVFVLLAYAGSWIGRVVYPKSSSLAAFIFTALFYGAIYKLNTFLPDLSTYPLSLAWSETSRYYYASLFFAERIYGLDVPPSVLHPSRYLLQSIPFLLGDAPLWLHRLWQVILWIAFSLLTGVTLMWRVNQAPVSNAAPAQIMKNAPKIALVLWAFLFLFQGPVYYHLLLMVILILWGFDQKRFWKTALIVLIASLWAGISRVNWFPVPGLMASALYLLQAPLKGKSIWRYLSPPVIWTVSGILAALLSQRLYILWSGNPQEQFASSFTSDLLWYRLFPNPTYPLGILLSISLVSLPLLITIVFQQSRVWSRFHFIRQLGLVAILFVLFGGGIVVSLKIGGGSNLHNFDAFLVLLLLIGSYIALGRFLEDGKVEAISRPLLGNQLLLAVVIALPVYFAISSGGKMASPSRDAAQEAINTIEESIKEKAASEREILFISQRHLLTFGAIQDVHLIPGYEKVFLMEMAMSGSEGYLQSFYGDLRNQRYDLIITDPLKIIYQGRLHSFGEENDAWVSRVSEPVLCYYEPLVTLTEVDTEILVPRSQPCE